MDTESNKIQNLQYKVAINRTLYTKNIEKLLKKKNEAEINKVSNIQFEQWEDSNIKVPEFKVPDLTPIPVTEKQKMEQIKGRIWEQMRLMKIIENRKSNKIAQLVDKI